VTPTSPKPERRRFRPRDEVSKALSSVVRVWPYDGLLGSPGYREMGCDAQKFYLVHPDDPGGEGIVCEHEILTD